MTITQFDRTTLARLRPEIDDALKAVGIKYGIRVTTGNAVYAGPTATIKLELSVQGEDGSFVTPAANNFVQYATVFGLQSDDLGKSFNLGSYSYKIVGLNPRSRNKPILCERGGKSYKVNADAVRRGLGRSRA